MAKKKKKEKSKAAKIIGGFFKVFFTLLAAVLIFALGSIYIFERGPSEEVRDLFVVTVQQSSAAKPLARLFLSEETVKRIMEENTAKDEDLITDGDMIEIDDTLDMDAIIIEDVHGPTFNGKMMIVNDPSRVYVYDIPNYYAEWGMMVSDMVKAEDAIAGVNGGGFLDVNGLGSGAMPLGIVMSKGEWKNGNLGDSFQVIGFDNDNKLVVGYMTGYQAVERGVRDAVAWGPALIINGEAVDVGNGGGLNPRTAIGQRADGAVLLLVVDGRQPSSIGASYYDLIGVMQQYGAVNAANLDGGNSSSMVYDGKVITNTASLNGERELPTAFLVKKR